MEDRVLKRETEAKCSQYLSSNANKHRRSPSSTKSSKKISPGRWSGSRSVDVKLLMSQKLQENTFLLELK